MRLATTSFLLLGTLLPALTLPASAQQIESETAPGFFGFVNGTPDLAVKPDQRRSGASASAIVYDNTGSPPNFGFSSTDLTADWGDRLILTAMGLLSSHLLTIFNPSTSAGNLLTASFAVDFYDFATTTYLGGYSAATDFGSGLPPGFFSFVTVPALEVLGIDIPDPDILVIQSITSHTGPANRLGIASCDPPTVGSSPGTMYIRASTVGGGVAGFYNIGTPPVPANPGYQVTITDTPTGATSHTWGRIKKLYR